MTTTEILCPDGQALNLIKLSHASGLTLDLIDWGATWVSCRMPVAGTEREVLLGHATLADYFTQQGYLGVTVGRFANRIGNSRIERDGRVFQLTSNQGVHQLQHLGVTTAIAAEHKGFKIIFVFLTPKGHQAHLIWG